VDDYAMEELPAAVSAFIGTVIREYGYLL